MMLEAGMATLDDCALTVYATVVSRAEATAAFSILARRR